MAPAVHLLIDSYCQATAHYSPIKYLYLNLSVELYTVGGEMFKLSILHFLYSIIPAHFNWIDRQQHRFSQSG
jgi:hypothetical protein